MSIQLLFAAIALMLGTPLPPNYYGSYTSAKKASKDAQKELIVFFGSSTCSNCEAAWSAFTKDAVSTQKYVSTKMEADDFDGAVCLAYYELKDVPAWVIISPSAEVKEKWVGGWKDAAGNPTAFDMSVSKNVVKEEKKVNTTIQNPSTSTVTKTTSTTTPKENQASIAKESQQASIKTSAISTNVSPSGLVLQAGYFGSEANAQKLISDLKSKGFSNFKIAPEQKDGKTFYRVISKAYASESEVNAEQQHLSTEGFKTSVKK